MTKGRELQWKIDAYTRDTMPLGRLANYLRELSLMLGEDHHVHLIRIESASTVPVFKIDDEAADRVYARAAEVRLGTAPRDAMRSYDIINRMLSEDSGTAILLEEGAEIIPFPGREEPPPAITGIQQQGKLDGRLQKVGGAKEWVPIQLQMPDETSLSGCYAKRALAKEMARRLFEPVRLYGRGRWSRNAEGEWGLDRFVVDSFEPLDEQTLPSVVAALHAVRADWPDDPIAILDSLRHGDGETD